MLVIADWASEIDIRCCFSYAWDRFRCCKVPVELWAIWACCLFRETDDAETCDLSRPRPATPLDEVFCCAIG